MKACVLFLTLGKLGGGVLMKLFIERRPVYFSSHLRCRLLWQFALRCLQLCLTIAWRLLFVLSIQVALLACVLIGSLVKLSFSFCKQSLLASCRGLMLSLAMWSHQRLLFGFKSPSQYLTPSWCSAKNKVMLGLLPLLYSTLSCSN